MLSVQGQDGEVDIEAEMEAIQIALGKRMGGEKLDGYPNVPYSQYYEGGEFSMNAQNDSTLFPGSTAKDGVDRAKADEEKRNKESDDAARDAAREVFPFPPSPLSFTPDWSYLTAPTWLRAPGCDSLDRARAATEGGGGEEDGGGNAGATKGTT